MAKAGKNSDFEKAVKGIKKDGETKIAKCETIRDLDILEQKFKMFVKLGCRNKDERIKIEDMVIDLIRLCLTKSLELYAKDYDKRREHDELVWREKTRRELRAFRELELEYK